MKRCRICGDEIRADARYCSPACRLDAIGRQDLVVKKDVRIGWNMVQKTTTRRQRSKA